MASTQTCYMCDAPATSAEHAPPKCLFPEQKDADGVDYRKKLITVPSCNVHNSQKSHDDTYLLYVLNSVLGANSASSQLFSTKITRDIGRNPSLIKRLAAQQLAVTLQDDKTGEFSQGIAIKIERNRIINSFEHMARAIYYHHFGEKYAGVIEIHPGFMLNLESNDVGALEYNNAIREIEEASIEYLQNVNAELNGENPEIFFYQVSEAMDGINFIMRFTFYSAINVTMLFK